MLKVLHAFAFRGVRLTEPDDRNGTARRKVVIQYVESAFLEVIAW
ncbi:hypothetical protein [Cohnella sp. REN36]|nr:hypothetical protein [Cohnella sp. REN36]